MSKKKAKKMTGEELVTITMNKAVKLEVKELRKFTETTLCALITVMRGTHGAETTNAFLTAAITDKARLEVSRGLDN